MNDVTQTIKRPIRREDNKTRERDSKIRDVIEFSPDDLLEQTSSEIRVDNKKVR